MAALAGMDYLVTVFDTGSGDLRIHLYLAGQPDWLTILWSDCRESHTHGMRQFAQLRRYLNDENCMAEFCASVAAAGLFYSANHWGGATDYID